MLSKTGILKALRISVKKGDESRFLNVSDLLFVSGYFLLGVLGAYFFVSSEFSSSLLSESSNDLSEVKLASDMEHKLKNIKYENRIKILSEEIRRVREYEELLKRKAKKVDLVISKTKSLSKGGKRSSRSGFSKKGGKLASLTRTYVFGGIGGADERVFIKDVTPVSFSESYHDDSNLESSVSEELDLLEKRIRETPIGTPVGGFVSSPYGLRRSPFGKRRLKFHHGIDIVAPFRTPVKVTADGIVSRSRWTGGYGKVVIVKHADGLETRYAHLSRLKVRKGERVKKGDVIGLLGSTGRSTGAHVHYEVRVNNKPVNPYPFIELANVLASI